jgi:hypothetical protein
MMGECTSRLVLSEPLGPPLWIFTFQLRQKVSSDQPIVLQTISGGTLLGASGANCTYSNTDI